MYERAVQNGQRNVIQSPLQSFVRNECLPKCTPCNEADFSSLEINKNKNGGGSPTLIIKNHAFNVFRQKFPDCIETTTFNGLSGFQLKMTKQFLHLYFCSTCDCYIRPSQRTRIYTPTESTVRKVKHMCQFSSESESDSSNSAMETSPRSLSPRASPTPSTPSSTEDEFETPTPPLFHSSNNNRLYRCGASYKTLNHDTEVTVKCLKQFQSHQEWVHHRQGCSIRFKFLSVSQKDHFANVLYTTALSNNCDAELANAVLTNVLSGNHSPNVTFAGEVTQPNLKSYTLRQHRKQLFIYDETRSLARRRPRNVSLTAAQVYGLLNGSFSHRKYKSILKTLRNAHIPLPRDQLKNLNDFKKEVQSSTSLVLLENVQRNQNASPTNSIMISIREDSVIGMLREFIARNQSYMDTAHTFVLSADHGGPSLKITGIFLSEDYTWNKPLLLLAAWMTESQKTLKQILEHICVDMLAAFILSLDLSFKICCDLKTVHFILQTEGSQSSLSCVYCKKERKWKRCDDWAKYGEIKNRLCYGIKDGQIDVSPYFDKIDEDRPINENYPPIVKSLFSVTGCTKVQQLFIPGPLHLKLNFYRFYLNAVDYR